MTDETGIGGVRLVEVRPPHKCMFCGKWADPIRLPEDKVAAWRAGEFIQRAFPELPPDQREILISGSHPDCFDTAFADEDDEG